MVEAQTQRSLVQNSMNHSVEHMLGSLIGYRSTLEIMRQRYADDPENLIRVNESMKKLSEAELAVIPGFASRKKIFAGWNLLHQVSEDLFLLLTPEEFLAEGRKLMMDMRMSSLPEPTRKYWDTIIEECLKTIIEGKDISSCRHSLKMAMNTLNTQMDTLFWDIWVRKLFTLIYTIMLLGMLVGLYIMLGCPPKNDIYIGAVLLLGSIGGVASGIMNGEPLYIAKGHFWVSFYYYLLSRPVQGALAALIMFWLLQSQYLIQIHPALGEKPVFTATTSAQIKPVAKIAITEPKAATGESTKNTNDTKNNATFIVLNAANNKQIYLYMLVLLIAGFTGDRLLKTVSEKVTSRMFTEAEKTKESKDGK